MQSSTSKTVEEALKSFASDGQLPIRISGSCMMPLIKDGTQVEVSRQKLYWPGDILVKRLLNGQLIAHRFIGCYPRKGKFKYVTRADNASNADGAVAAIQIIGRVSGGDCNKAAFSIPLRNRIKAIGQFTFLVIQRLGVRTPKYKRI